MTAKAERGPKPGPDLAISVHQVARVMLGCLLVAQVALTAAHLTSLGLAPTQFERKLVGLDHEANIPAWWHACVLFTTGLVALIAAPLHRARVAWLVVALGLIGLSLEEIAQLHETIAEKFPGIGAERVELWVLLYLPVFLIGAIAVALVCRSMGRQNRRLAELALACYLLVPLLEVAGLTVRFSEHRVIWHSLIVLEENFEMLGTTLLSVAIVSSSLSQLAATKLRLLPEQTS